MLFASIELAARIEAAECRLLADCAASARRRHPEIETWVRPIAGGIATVAGHSSPLDKVAGLGFAGPIDEAGLEEIEQAFARQGAPVRVELSSLADPSSLALLAARGYAPVGFENVLGRALSVDDARTLDGDAEISHSGDEELNVWLDVVVTGFAHPDGEGVASDEQFAREALERVVGDMASAPHFVRYLARRAGVPAGGASLRLCDGVAQLCGAATVPAHRRRGIQTALLAARLHEAARAGCDLAVVTTLPGSRSQLNVQRHGFSLLYTRAILVRESPTAP